MHTRDKIKNKKENRINASVCALEGGKYRKNSESSPPAKNKYVRRRRARAPPPGSKSFFLSTNPKVFSETTAFRTSRKVRRNITGPIYACPWAPAEMCVCTECVKVENVTLQIITKSCTNECQGRTRETIIVVFRI